MNPFVALWSRKRILRRGRLTGCMVLIALVTAPLVIALIFSRSMMSGIADRFIYLSDGHVQITGADNSSIPQDNILCMDDTVTGYALMYGASDTASVSLKGVREDYFNSYRLKYMDLEYLPVEERSGLNRIILSETTSRKLNLKAGDRVALMVVPDTEEGVLRPVMLQVGGIYSCGYEQIDSNLAFIDYSYAIKLFESAESRISEIILKTEFQNKLNEIKHIIKTDGIITDWQQNNISIYNNYIVSMQSILMVLIIIVVVAAFFTASVANQIVEDDSREIALAKLLGSTDSNVRKSAFLSIFAVTLSGMAIGLSLGILIGMNFSPVLVFLSEKNILTLDYYLVDFKATIPWSNIGLIMLIMAAVSAISVMISLRHTRKITPMRLFTGV